MSPQRTRRRRRTHVGGAAFVVVGLLAVAACAGGTSNSSGSSTSPVVSSPSTSAAAPVRPVPPVAPGSFRVASFNILGASHTAPGGDMAARPSGVRRARWAVRVLSERDIDVVGLQEVEPPAYRSFKADDGGAWSFYPGDRHGDFQLANTIGWRSAEWRFVSGRLFPIPYFRGGIRRVPVVLLRNVRLHRSVYFVNVHNPANTARFGDSASFRARALVLEAAQLRRLVATRVPVVMTGDFNAKRPALCAVTAVAGFHSANGSSPAANGCRPSTVAGVDWIFGSAQVAFRHYARDKDALVSRTSDHPIVYADVTLR